MEDHKEAPKYRHDCADCTFLGCITYRGTDYDLYFHPGTYGERTVVARYGVDEDYTSGLHAATVFPELAAAKALAVQRGLLNDAPTGSAA